ncbi:MAG: HEAT repeat domain-containing protein [Saprospiraceae bacterium]|nr:HEAT repeat domain-containing protein [Saprospiraceae bacterium]
MPAISRLLLFPFFAAVLRLSAQITPEIGVNIDILHTKITLQFDWEKRQALGETTIVVRLTAPVRSIALAADDLDIKSVTTGDGQNLDFNFKPEKAQLDIQTGREYPAGEVLTFTITYKTMHHNDPDPNALGGSFGKGLRFFSPSAVNPIKRRQIWSQGELQNNSSWFPCTHNISDLHTTEFIATVDSGLTVISNGIRVAVTDAPGGKRTFHYRSDQPYPAYLTAFAVGVYTDVVQNVDGISMHTLCYPDEKEAAIATTERLPAMLRFLTEQTGLKYPFAEYTQVMVQDYPFPSLNGQQTFSLISDNMIDDYGTHRDFLYLWDGVEFNALAGQWFGNVLIPKNVEDIWLAKSFSQYFEGLFTAQQNGPEEYLLWYLPWETGSIQADWANGNRHPIVTADYGNAENFAADSYAKYRGALVLRMLRKELGDAQFFASIRHFLQTNAFRPASTRDFLASIKAVSSADLDWFFDQWMYKTGYPVFQITDEYDAQNRQYRLKIKQVQQPDTASSYPRAAYFQGKMEVEIDNRIEVVRIEPQENNEFTFSLPKRPKLVNADIENTWIGEKQVTKTWQEWLYQFEHSRDAQSRNAAMLELSAIAQSGNTTDSAKKQIYAAFRRVIQRSCYWRLRFNAIGQLRAIEPPPYNKATVKMLQALIRQDKSWVRAAAITSLGMTNDPQFAEIYMACLSDSSDRVVNAAAVALGKTKSPKAFDALVHLKNRPSWKSQSLMHALSGLAQLNDPRAEAIAVAAIADNRSPRWFLGNGWDYPYVAAQTLAAIGKPERAFPIVQERIDMAMQGNNIDDVFHQALLIATLADPRGQAVFDGLKMKYKDRENAMIAINMLEEQYKAALKAR